MVNLKQIKAVVQHFSIINCSNIAVLREKELNFFQIDLEFLYFPFYVRFEINIRSFSLYYKTICKLHLDV